MVDPSDLSGTALFAALEPEALGPVASRATLLALERGDVVFRQGDPASELFVVRSGRVAIATQSPDGRESVVAIMGPGDLFGDLPLFDGLGRSADARALERTTLIAVPYDPVRSALAERPTALWGVVELLARRLRATDEALADSMFLDVPGRTAKRLLELAAGADEFMLPLTQEELAGLVGASRERVNKAISAFIRLGWIAQEGRRYKILDRTQLERRAR